MGKLNKNQKQMLVRVLKLAIDNGEFSYTEYDYTDEEIERNQIDADKLIDTLIVDYKLKW